MPSHVTRDAERSNTFFAGFMVMGGVRSPVKIRNLSSSGALIESNSEVSAGCTLLIEKGELFAAGEVVWHRGNISGLRFSEAVDVDLWFGRKIAAPPGDEAGPREKGISDQILMVRLSEEVSSAARAIEALANQLASDPILRMRHARALQELAFTEEILSNISQILVQDDRTDWITQHATTALRRRLLRN